jgi:hypothetical protein
MREEINYFVVSVQGHRIEISGEDAGTYKWLILLG